MKTLRSTLLLTLFSMSSASLAVEVFFTDFETGLPLEISTPGASIQQTQGYAGIANPSNPLSTFGSGFLRYDSTGIENTTLTLTELPTHDVVSIGMLLAVIDSWDNTEVLEISLDGRVLFSNQWQLALGDSSSYIPPLGGLLSSGSNLGFNGSVSHVRDRAYDLSLDSAFTDIPHSGSTLILDFTIESATAGPAAQNWQGGLDESWAIDNLSVSTDLIGLGDYNSNGFVDAPDYTVWRDSLGSTTELAADGNGNGIVDEADYALWRDTFGAEVGVPVAVPESRSLLLLAMCLAIRARQRCHARVPLLA
ncbi:MAG: hypothetical protein AAGJ46_01095 [Planctomycetota bacterium]